MSENTSKSVSENDGYAHGRLEMNGTLAYATARIRGIKIRSRFRSRSSKELTKIRSMPLKVGHHRQICPDTLKI